MNEGDDVSYSQNFAHHIGCSATDFLAKIVESFQISLVQGVTNDFNVHLIQILFGDTVDEERRQWRIDQNGIIQFGWIGRHMNGLHLLETAQWMAFWDQFRDWALMQCARNQQNNVVNHVAVCDKVQECGQWLDGMIAQVLEFDDQFLA